MNGINAKFEIVNQIVKTFLTANKKKRDINTYRKNSNTRACQVASPFYTNMVISCVYQDGENRKP